MAKIQTIFARAILNSKGDYTIQAIAIDNNGTKIYTSIPAGTSTGTKEAIYTDTQTAITTILTQLKKPFLDYINQNKSLKEFHDFLKTQDNSINKKKLGANVFLVMENLYIKALAHINNTSLYKQVYTEAKKVAEPQIKMPTPLFNIINGGVHASNYIPFQEFWIIPTGLPTISEQIYAGTKIYHTLKESLKKQGFSTLTGLEGGFAPILPQGVNQALDLILDAIYKAGYKTGKEITLGIDAAASEFTTIKGQEFFYKIYPDKDPISHSEYLKFWEQITSSYPIILVEDPLHEQTPLSLWAEFLEMLSLNVIDLIGDDLTVTNPQIFKNALDHKAISGGILKPNQVGSLIETFESFNVLSKSHSVSIMSHRSGETNDSLIADISVGLGTTYIKSGAPAHGERVAKYNRLLEIDLQLAK